MDTEHDVVAENNRIGPSCSVSIVVFCYDELNNFSDTL